MKNSMVRWAAIAALAWPAIAAAATHTLTIASEQGNISCTEHSKTAATIKALFAGGGADTLGAGDTVNFTPNSSFTWDAGSGSGWSPAVGASGSTWLTINGNGVVLSESVNTAEVGVITLSNISGVLLSNIRLRNIHASGALSSTLVIKSTSTAMYDIVVRDVTIMQPVFNSLGAAAPFITVEQEDVPECPIYASFERVNCNMDQTVNGRPICNVVNDSYTAMTRRGQVYFIDCDFSGINYTSDASTADAADDALGCNAAADVYVVGGRYHDCEGAGITQDGGNATHTRLFVYGVETFNCNARAAPGTLGGTASVVAQMVDSCYLHHATNGVKTLSYTPVAGSITDQGLAVVRNCRIVRDPAKRLAGTVELNGIEVATRNTLIENNIIEGYHEGHTSASPDRGILVGGTSDSMEGGTLSIYYNWIKECRRHISDNTAGSSRCLYYDIVGNLFTLTKTSLGTSTGKVRLWNIFARDSARPAIIRTRNNISIIDILTAEFNEDYLMYAGADVLNSGTANSTATNCGYNYWWRNPTKTLGFHETWVTLATDKITNVAADKPLIDSVGRQLSSSPALAYGKASFDEDANFRAILASAANATTDGAGTSFDSATYSDWTATGAAAGDVVVIISGTGATAGTYEIIAVASGALTLERSAGASATAITFRLEASTSNVNPGKYAYGTIAYTTTSAGTVPRNTNLTFTMGSGTAAVTENLNMTGNSLIVWYDGADAGSVADVVMVRRIAEDKAGVIQIDFPMTGLPASTAITLQCLVVPTIWPANMDLTNAGRCSMNYNNRWSESGSSDIFGRFIVPTGRSGVAVTSHLLGIGRGVGGPFAVTPLKTDFRENAPSRGWYPGRTDPFKSPIRD